MFVKKNGNKYEFNGETYKTFGLFIVAYFGKSLSELMDELYIQKEMSSEDIRKHFLDLFGFAPSVRMIHNLIVESGVSVRGRAECKALSWKQGKMDASVAKTRQGIKKAYAMGSSAERKVRYLLREAIIALNPPWQIVIGDHLQHIDPRYEIDIPIVIIAPAQNRCVKIAVEIDSAYTHGSESKQRSDARKERELEKIGWKVLRISGDRMNNKSVLLERVADLSIEVYNSAVIGFSL